MNSTTPFTFNLNAPNPFIGIASGAYINTLGNTLPIPTPEPSVNELCTSFAKLNI